MHIITGIKKRKVKYFLKTKRNPYHPNNQSLLSCFNLLLNSILFNILEMNFKTSSKKITGTEKLNTSIHSLNVRAVIEKI